MTGVVQWHSHPSAWECRWLGFDASEERQDRFDRWRINQVGIDEMFQPEPAKDREHEGRDHPRRNLRSHATTLVVGPDHVFGLVDRLTAQHGELGSRVRVTLGVQRELEL